MQKTAKTVKLFCLKIFMVCIQYMLELCIAYYCIVGKFGGEKVW